MTRTKNQRKGDSGESNAQEGDRLFKGRIIKEKPKNNKGYDYEWEDGNIEVIKSKKKKKGYVEVKTGKSKQTKAQKEFEEEVGEEEEYEVKKMEADRV